MSRLRRAEYTGRTGCSGCGSLVVLVVLALAAMLCCQLTTGIPFFG